MSNNNLPFGSPLYNDDEDFTFPVEASHYPVENQLLSIENQITQDNLATSSSLPIISEYDDLSMFLDDHIEEDYYSLLQEPENTSWAQQGSINVTTTMTTMGNDSEEGAFDVGEGSSSTKKLSHNAKERVRRMKLNAIFLSLRSLLPQSRRPKKRCSAPYVIDRALEYIPQLQSEIEKLTLEKDNLVSLQRKNTTPTSDDDQPKEINIMRPPTLTVSITKVNESELIIQLCEHKDKAGVLTTLIEKLEGDEGVQVLGASSLSISDDRSCFHIHIQMSGKPRESDYVAVLHQKIISWLS